MIKELCRDEAILSTRTVRADIDAQGYRFAITRRDGWQPLTAAGFAPEAWTSGISPALPRDAQTLSIAFDPLGAAQPTELALSDGREWLVGDRFTIADIVIGYAAFLATTLGADDVLGEATKAWLARCMARGGFVRARERQKTA